MKVIPGPARDIAVASVAAVAAAASLRLGVRSDQPALEWALVEAAAVSLVLVRRMPVVVVAVTSALTVIIDVLLPSSMSHVAPFAAAFAVGVVGYRHGWVVTGLSWAVTTTAVLISFPGDLLVGADGLVRIVAAAAAVAAPAAFGRYLAGVRQAATVAEERARDAEERSVAEAQAARMAERARLAGDLHDLVAHHVSAIAMQAGSGLYAAEHGRGTERRLTEAMGALETIHSSSRQALVDLRSLLRLLRDPDNPDPVLDPEGMIAEAVERSRKAGLDVAVRMDQKAGDAPLALRVTAARVVQEALTNALKHAGPGADVATTVSVADDGLRIEIANTLPAGPHPVLPQSGHGLTGMRERVEILGGTFAAGPSGTGGWTLCVTLPIAASA